MSEVNNIFKERFEYIIGFVALTISVGEFKDELDKVNITIPYLSFNLTQYFIAIILAAIVGLHFYFLPQFIKGEGRIRNRLKTLFTTLCYAILLFIVITPFVIGAAYLITIIKIPKIDVNPTQRDFFKGLYMALIISWSIYSVFKTAAHVPKWKEREKSEIKKIGEGMTLDEYIKYRHDEMLETWVKLYNEKLGRYKEMHKQKEAPAE